MDKQQLFIKYAREAKTVQHSQVSPEKFPSMQKTTAHFHDKAEFQPMSFISQINKANFLECPSLNY